jgi:hypothetical protein
MSHRACLLNDNLDGTMSVIGKRKTADVGSGRMPPIVISRNPIDVIAAAPKASPRQPGRRRKLERKEEGGANHSNPFQRSIDEKEELYSVSRFSSSSSSELPGDLPSVVGTNSGSGSQRSNRAADIEPSTPEEVDGGDADDGSGSSDSSILFSPEAARHSPGYKTALSARVAGRARMVSIRKANRVTPAIKMKRQSSIRRLASKLGAKAARREALVYKPSGNTVPEDQAGRYSVHI